MKLKVRVKERRIGIILNNELTDMFDRYKKDDFFTLSKVVRKFLYDVLDGKREPPPQYHTEDKEEVGMYVLRISPVKYMQMREFIRENNYRSVNNLLRCIVYHYIPELDKIKYEFETN